MTEELLIVSGGSVGSYDSSDRLFAFIELNNLNSLGVSRTVRPPSEHFVLRGCLTPHHYNIDDQKLGLIHH